jgi:hypothetical protein
MNSAGYCCCCFCYVSLLQRTGEKLAYHSAMKNSNTKKSI